MKLHNYETGRALTDINIELTRSEAEELVAYVGRMLACDELKTVYISDLNNGVIASELSVSLDGSTLVA